MLKIIVGDVDEPPHFSMPSYVMDVYENAKVGTIVGTVLAQDPDSANSLVRYGILGLTGIKEVVYSQGKLMSTKLKHIFLILTCLGRS